MNEDHFGIHRQEVKRNLDLANDHTSLEELLTNDPLDSQAHNIPNNTVTLEQDAITQSLLHSIEELLPFLSERERFILIHRFGLNGNECLSLSKIGVLLGVTKERTRQLEKQALEQAKTIAHKKQMPFYYH